MLKTTLIGAGAIGGMIASRLQRSNTPVSLLVRPGQVRALEASGLRMREGDALHTTQHSVASNAEDLGVQDLVFVCVKAPALLKSIAQFAPLIGPETVIVPALNGVPWWFFESFDNPLRGQRLRTVDPLGEVERCLPAAQTLGCVVYLAAYVDAQGVVTSGAANRLILGDAVPGGNPTRLDGVAQLLRAAGFSVDLSPSIQNEVWLKLWGNVTGNPIGALTGCNIPDTLANPYTLRLVTSMMEEAQCVAQRLGISLGTSIERRIEGMRQLLGAKSSMLQDFEAGRALEIDGIVGAVSEIGDLVGVDTPFIDAVLGLVQQRAGTSKLWIPAAA